MITALLHVFHLLARQRSAQRPGPCSEPGPSPESSPRHAPPVVRRRRIPSGAVPYLRALRGDVGMTTAEYAVGTVAAVAFAVVLFRVVQSPAVHSALAAVVTGALNVHL
jgi:hypothetical protein